MRRPSTSVAVTAAAAPASAAELYGHVESTSAAEPRTTAVKKARAVDPTIYQYLSDFWAPVDELVEAALDGLLILIELPRPSAHEALAILPGVNRTAHRARFQVLVPKSPEGAALRGLLVGPNVRHRRCYSRSFLRARVGRLYAGITPIAFWTTVPGDRFRFVLECATKVPIDAR